MKISLIGHGSMGKLIEQLARERGHEIGAVIDHRHDSASAQNLAAELRGCDVAIDFTIAEAVRRNVEAGMIAGVPIVEGTTGWADELGQLEQLVVESGGAMVYGANFSIGVNLFYRITQFAAELMSRFPEYEAFLEEQHHSRKKDAPSGTALKLKEIMAGCIESEISVASTRAGNIPGTHRVGFDGTADQILLQHTARSREGFALGALRAAEWIIGKRGLFEFGEVLQDIIDGKSPTNI